MNTFDQKDNILSRNKREHTRFKRVFKLYKYYFSSIIKKNLFFIFLCLLTSLFLSFALPLCFWLTGKHYLNHPLSETNKDSFLESLTREVIQERMDNKKFLEYGRDHYLPSEAFDNLFDNYQGIKEEEERIVELEAKRRASRRQNPESNEYREIDREIKRTIVKLDSKRKWLKMKAMSVPPLLNEKGYLLSSGLLSLKEGEKGKFWASFHDSALWFFGTGVIFFLSSWVIRKLFGEPSTTGEDAMLMTSIPKARRSDLLISKFLVLYSFLSLFAFVGFFYPVLFCCLMFGGRSGFIQHWGTTVLFLLMMVFLAPILFIIISSPLILVSKKRRVHEVVTFSIITSYLAINFVLLEQLKDNIRVFKITRFWKNNPFAILILIVPSLIFLVYYIRSVRKKEIIEK